MIRKMIPAPLPLTPAERRFIEELARWQARKDLAAAEAQQRREIN